MRPAWLLIKPGSNSSNSYGRPHTVNLERIVMSPFSPLAQDLLQVPKSSLLKFKQNVQDYGRYPIGILLSLIVLYAAFYLATPHRKPPPGPRGYPIIGNILDLRSGQWLKFTEWRKKYGQCFLSVLRVSWPILKRIRSGQVILSTSMQLDSQ